MNILINEAENGYVISDENRSIVVNTEEMNESEDCKALLQAIYYHWFYKSKHEPRVCIDIFNEDGEICSEE